MRTSMNLRHLSQAWMHALFGLAALAVTVPGQSAVSFARQTDVPPAVARVNYDFQNVLHETSATVKAAVTVYSGSVGPYKAPAAPAGTTATLPVGTTPVYGNIALVESGMGAPLSGDVPYGNFAAETIRRAQRLLYWRVDNTAEENDKAAFRYLVKLYGPDTGTATTAAGLARSAALGSEEAQRELERRNEIHREATSSLESLAATEVPSLDDMIASLPDGVNLTDEQLQALEHRRQVMLRRVDYAKRQLKAGDALDTRRQQGRATADSIRCNFEDISDYYGDAERARVEQALDILRQAIKYAPLNRTLSNVYLDVFYDRCVAELQFIKIAKVERAQYRLGLKALPVSKQFVIDQEIEILNDSILPNYQAALSGLSEMLTERGGVDVASIDPKAPPCTPLGYYMFQREQPDRNKMAARYVDGNGNLQTVPRFDPVTSSTSAAERTIFDGYKDYVMVLTILSDYLTDAADLSRLYGMRGRQTDTMDDRATALDLIQKLQRETTVDVKLLEAMFADYTPQPGDASGVFAARQGIATGLGELEGVRNFLLGTANALGFDPDFLVLIKEFPDSTQGNQFDSYDALVRWIRNTDTSVYNFAKTTYQVALDRYDEYRAAADELYAQLDDIQTEFADRYFEIVGTADLDNTEVTINNPAPGSELYQALQTISNLQEKNSLMGELSTELNGAIQESTVYKTVTVPGKESNITNILTKYKNTVSSEFDTITHWSATAAGSQAAYDTFSDAWNTVATSAQLPWSVAAGAASAAAITAAGIVNTALQITAATKQGNAEKAIDAAQATFDADLALNDIATDKHDAAQELSALRREQIGNAIESTGLQGELAQANGQYVALLREVSRIIQRAQENTEDLSDRYFADPIHQLRAQSTQLRADNAFRDAQRWVYFTQRALEYKWNKPFAIRVANKDYDAGTILKVRNFVELEDLMVAIEQFNTYNLIGFNREPFVDRLSLKYDFFGYRDEVRYAVTNADGTSVTVDADEAFRRRVAKLVNHKTGVLEIPLDTFSVTKQDGVFFSGPEYDNTGKVFSAGKYLDKVEWMKFNIVSDEKPTVITGAYTYGGTSYIRTRMPACLNLLNDREMPGEFVRFPFRYFLTLDNGATWLQRPTQEDTVKIVVSRESVEPQDSAEDPLFRNTFLKERSVAATQQKLSIMASKVDISKMKDIEIYVRHLFVSRELPVCN